jgi:ribonucleoside-triphosphate reductase
MNHLKMNPSRDAGRFAYHLKFLLKAALVEVDSDAKKYLLTELGKMVLDVAERIEKRAVKPKGMLVRTSHFTFEEFDSNKIANALIKEAKIPADIAQKTAKDTEKLLLKSKIKYLTAPLIREIVNAILIEKGMEDYRHKLTRLGLPVHEVTTLIESKDKTGENEAALIMAGKTVFREYMLLNVFPRDIADAHVSGALHINGLSTWILKPNEIMHDLRFFLQNGLRIGNINAFRHSEKPADTFESALLTVVNVLLFSHQEVNQTQTLDHFNLFLAPYIKGIAPVKIKDILKHFLVTLNQLVDTTIAFELTVPEFITDKPAIGPQGAICGKYIDYIKESKLLAELTVEIYLEANAIKPFLNPKLVFKIDKDTILNDKSRNLLLKAHELVANQGAVYFGSILQKEVKSIAYSASGIKLEANITDDWETDTLRTGCLGHVTINLPRIAHECDKDKAKFFDLLKERCELAARAIAIKNRAIKQYGKNNLPFLMHGVNGDSYFRLENCSGVISFAGLKEAVEKFTNKPLGQQENLKFAEEIIQNAQTGMQKIGRKHGRRLFLSILQSSEAAIRLAQLDIEKFGVAKVKFSGTRDKPFYSTTRRLQLQAGNFASVPSDQLDWEHRLKGLNSGGNLTIIDMNSVKHEPEDLLKLTMHLMEKQDIEFLTYNRIITYCSNCQKSWIENLHKCPSCGAMGTLIVFDRFLST